MQKYILVKADTNDGDYITSFTPISNEALATLAPLIEKIKACPESHNFPTGDYDPSYDGEEIRQLYVSPEAEEQDEKVLELFCNNYIPVSENGFHTIKDVSVYEVGHIEKLL